MNYDLSTKIYDMTKTCPLRAIQPIVNVSLMDDKKIIRIAVTPAAKAVIEQWKEVQDMTEIGVASRIYEWFGRQPEELQRGILGLYGKRGPDITRMAMESLAKEQAFATPLKNKAAKAHAINKTDMPKPD